MHVGHSKVVRVYLHMYAGKYVGKTPTLLSHDRRALHRFGRRQRGRMIMQWTLSRGELIRSGRAPFILCRTTTRCSGGAGEARRSGGAAAAQ